MKKVLYLTIHRRDRSPSQRFRIEQYIEYLKDNGYDYDFSNLLSKEDDEILYSKGKYLQKFLLLLKNILKRFKDIVNARKYDIIFIQRSAFLLGTTFFERKIKERSGGKVIYDFDDAIWIHKISEANKLLGLFKNPNTTNVLIEKADLVIAGNKYLHDYAANLNDNVEIIPTTIDTDEYIPQKKSSDGTFCIGWSGSFSTIEHFEHILEPLKIIKEKYDNIEIKVIGDENYVNKELDIKGIPWTKKDEIEVISSFDIGIMPLPNEEWTKGKCGLKGLQYMALEVPPVMSAVGVNKEIIKDGENGFLVNNNEEWVEKLTRLIESRELRIEMGKKARKTVVNKYSVRAYKEKYLSLFNQIL